jgi:hypothetical protein
MGVLPLMLKDGDAWESLGIDGSEIFFYPWCGGMSPRKTMEVKALKQDEKGFDSTPLPVWIRMWKPIISTVAVSCLTFPER